MMLEAALGRSWTAVDAKRLNDRLDQQAEESLSDEAYDFYCGHFIDALFNPEPEYEALLEAAIYGELTYLRSTGELAGQPSCDEEDDKTMVSYVLSDLDKYLDLNDDLAQDQDDDDTAVLIQEEEEEEEEEDYDCADVDDEDDDLADVDASFNEDDEAIVMSAIFKWRSCGVARMCVDDDEEEEGICVVCQDALEQGDGTITTIACQHEFHTKCIGRWLRESASCPLCNAYPYHD